MKLLEKTITFGILVPIYIIVVGATSLLSVFILPIVLDDEIRMAFRKLTESN